MTHIPEKPKSPKSDKPSYALPLFALLVIAGGVGLGLLSRPKALEAAELTPPPPSYEEALKAAEAKDAATAKTGSDASVSASASTVSTASNTTADAATTAAPKTFAVKAPVILAEVKPQYPEAARQVRVQGPVEVAMKVDAEGRPTDLRVLKGNLMLQKAALDAAQQWRFEPARLQGRLVPADYKVRFDFRL